MPFLGTNACVCGIYKLCFSSSHLQYFEKQQNRSNNKITTNSKIVCKLIIVVIPYLCFSLCDLFWIACRLPSNCLHSISVLLLDFKFIFCQCRWIVRDIHTLTVDISTTPTNIHPYLTLHAAFDTQISIFHFSFFLSLVQLFIHIPSATYHQYHWMLFFPHSVRKSPSFEQIREKRRMRCTILTI